MHWHKGFCHLVLQHGGVRSSLYASCNHGERGFPVPGKHSAPEGQVQRGLLTDHESERNGRGGRRGSDEEGQHSQTVRQ